jgi:hypothetical protein
VKGLTNGIAAILVGAFLGTVYFRGNLDAMSEAAKQDRGFVPWFVGVVVFLAVKDQLPGRSGDILATMVAIGFLIRGGPELFPAIDRFFGGS